MWACCGVKTTNICTDSGNLAKNEVLVVHDKLVGFDLVAKIYAITALGGMHITQIGAIQFCSNETLTCVVINHIDQIDFSVAFNHQQRVPGLQKGSGQQVQHQPSYTTGCQSTLFPRILGMLMNKNSKHGSAMVG